MPEVVSLLDALREPGIEASLFTTFNAYLPFYEDVVLRQLLSGGCRHNSVLMDSGRLAICLSEPDLRPASAGFDYTLAAIRSPAAFHPKLMLLVGPKRAITCVGSHNLTLSGFGINREVTGKFGSGTVGEGVATDVARAAWSCVKEWIASGGGALPRETVRNIFAIEDIAPWLAGARQETEYCRVLHQAAASLSLWEQLATLRPDGVKTISVLGAFFDGRGEFLRVLEAAYPNANLLVAIEPDTVQLTAAAARRSHASWRDASGLTARSGYLHAKLVYFDTGGRADLLLLGSANPSAPAWGIGGGGRNEELIVAYSGPRAREFAAALGLAEIKDLTELDATALKAIEAAGKARNENRPVASSPCGLATIGADGIQIPAAAVPGELVRIDALDERDGLLSENLKFSVHGDVVRATLATDLHERVRFLRVDRQGPPTVRLICHHAERRQAAARTGRQAQLRQALSSLDGDPTDLATLISAVQRVVFGNDTSVRPPAAPHRGSGASTATPEQTVSTLEGASDPQSKARARRRLAGGDLGYLLQVLIHELGKSLAPVTVGSGGATRSEEEQEGADDESPAEPDVPVETDRALAEACGRKVVTLVNRMVRVLEEVAESTDDALLGVAQLTAVLATLRSLRQLDRNDRWRRIGSSLVPEECRQKLLTGICNNVIGGKRPLVRRPEVIAAASSMEVVHLRGLMIWLAWECKFRADRRFALGDEIEDRRQNAKERAALLELVLPALPDADSRLEAERSIHATAVPRQVLPAAEWIQSHFGWGNRVAEDAARVALDPSRTAAASPVGSIVALATPSGQSLHVVAGHDGAKVVVLDLTAEGAEREFLQERVTHVTSP